MTDGAPLGMAACASETAGPPGRCPSCAAGTQPMPTVEADDAVISGMGLFMTQACAAGRGWHLFVTPALDPD